MKKSIRTLTALLLAISLVGCAEAKKALEDASSGLTAADLAKAWTSSCNAGSDPLSGGDHWMDYLTLNADGTYDNDRYWYIGTCLTMNGTVIYANSGTFAISGSTIIFDIATSTIMAFNVTAQGLVNTGCGMTSPYDAGVGGVSAGKNGISYTTFTILCSNQTLPNATDHLVGNMVELSGGVMMLGLGDETVQGVFSGAGSLPTATAIPYN